ncbi:hypothetical protein GDO81_009259 [Engystomops pustulosus]|uniref:Uncharacterized protein n=1 Tax=Engystomops pustulosus TaxID=76066 RepID=A0AAV7BQ19_ENGPU|nr:hypothetical protein GDO81_009259 [Engystomops pustulosus]
MARPRQDGRTTGVQVLFSLLVLIYPLVYNILIDFLIIAFRSIPTTIAGLSVLPQAFFWQTLATKFIFSCGYRQKPRYFLYSCFPGLDDIKQIWLR